MPCLQRFAYTNKKSSTSQGTFAKSYKLLGDRLSIYTYNDKEFVLPDSRQIISPPGAIPFLLKNLHSAHVGIERTVRLTKQLFFWHGMLNDLTTTINSCKACQLYAPSQKRKTIQSQPQVSFVATRLPKLVLPQFY